MLLLFKKCLRIPPTPSIFDKMICFNVFSVSVQIQQSYNVGDEITMCLMKRIKGSLLTAPVIHESPEKVCSVNTGKNFLISVLECNLKNCSI